MGVLAGFGVGVLGGGTGAMGLLRGRRGVMWFPRNRGGFLCRFRLGLGFPDFVVDG
jgi:hypothetical protein